LQGIWEGGGEPTNFIKKVRKFVWKNRIYRVELFGTEGGQMTKTLVGDFGAPFPEFLKTEIKESA
jgi:hypothetical protein